MEIVEYFKNNPKITFTIGIIIVLLTAILILYFWLFADREIIMDTLQDSKKPVEMSKDVHQVNTTEKGMGFTTSAWIHVRDWNYRYGEDKVIMQKGDFRVYIDKIKNDLRIDVPIFPVMQGNNDKAPLITKETLVYENIPLQKWIHIVVVLDNRSLDLWMNGKLYMAKHLAGIPRIDNKAPFTLYGGGGFDGWSGNIIHYRYPITKKMIDAIFWEGPIDLTFIGNIIRFIRRLFARLSSISLSFNVEMDEETRQTLTQVGRVARTAASFSSPSAMAAASAVDAVEANRNRR